jgi:TM2 domain-containing membrane protein YozV
MNIKKAIIKTNDVLAYIAFAVVLIIGLVMIIGGKIGAGLIVLVGGWVACSLVMGVWFVLSDMADSLRKIAGKK